MQNKAIGKVEAIILASVIIAVALGGPLVYLRFVPAREKAVTEVTTQVVEKEKTVEKPVAKLPEKTVESMTKTVESTTEEEEYKGVWINNRILSPKELEELKSIYGAAPPPGRYWYDSRSGLIGLWGREAAGFIMPGYDFGTLSPRASAGDTGLFINGRELPMIEVLFLQQLFGQVYRGRYWLDGGTGNIGVEGNPTPIANLVLALRQAQQAQQGGSTSYRYFGAGGSGAIEGRCVSFNAGSAGVFMNENC